MVLYKKIRELAGPLLDREIGANIAWLLSDKVFRLGVGFFISILIARYLGPSRLGVLSYALSLKAFFGAFVYLGLSGLVVRELVRSPAEENLILGTTFFLKLAGGGLGFVSILLFSTLPISLGSTETLVTLIIGLSLFPGAFDCIDFWFQSRVQAKYVVLSKNIAFAVTSSLKVLLVFLKADLFLFAAIYSLEFFLSSLLLGFFYRACNGHFKEWSFLFSKALELLKQSWIMILSGFFALVYLRIDQLMLRFMVGTKEVGIYSIAAQVSEVWYVIPTSIAISLFPKLIAIKKEEPLLYKESLQHLFDMFFCFSASIAVLCQVFACFIVPFLYGQAFQATAAILKIHIWAGVFMFQRALVDKWIFIEDLLIFSLVSQGVGAFTNVLLNILLIPIFLGRGAAIATLISYAASSYFFLFLSPKTRPLAGMITKSFLLPLRFLKKYENG